MNVTSYNTIAVTDGSAGAVVSALDPMTLASLAIRPASRVAYGVMLSTVGIVPVRGYVSPPVKKWNGTQWVVVQKGAYG